MTSSLRLTGNSHHNNKGDNNNTIISSTDAAVRRRGIHKQKDTIGGTVKHHRTCEWTEEQRRHAEQFKGEAKSINKRERTINNHEDSFRLKYRYFFRRLGFPAPKQQQKKKQ